MSLLFPDFSKSQIISVPYNYQPLSIFISALYDLRGIAGGEFEVSNVLKTCYSLLNKFISAREVLNQDLNSTQLMCRTLKQRSDLELTSKQIYRIVNHIELNVIISECLENIILNNNFDCYGLLVETEDQWSYFHNLLLGRELAGFVLPIFRKSAREHYYDIPIITFFPASWIPELITLPPSENFFLIHPESFSIQNLSSPFFKAPNNESIEITKEHFNLIKCPSIAISASQEFYDQFAAQEDNQTNCNSTNLTYTNFERPFLTIEVRNISGKTQIIECNKTYLTILKNGTFGYTSFENEDQLDNIKYIVDNIDTSNLTSEDLKREKNAMMEKWKKPLREHQSFEDLADRLKKLGALKTKIHNINYWGNPETIAPRSEEDFRAVLSFAGITDKSEIERFFLFARKRRGDSISDGHDKKIIGQEIVKKFLNDIKNKEDLKPRYTVNGIQFSIITLGE